MKNDTCDWLLTTMITFLLVLFIVTILHMLIKPPVGVVTIEPLQTISIDYPKPKPAPVAAPKPTPMAAPAPAPKPVLVNAPKLFKTFQVKYVIKASKEDFDCLARNIYYEARGESMPGKIAVASVTWNRVRAKRWGDTFCKVIYSPKQFSWTFQDVRFKLPAGQEWDSSKVAARVFLSGSRVVKLGGSDHYHERKISPKWNRDMKVKGIVGHHVFYTSQK